MVCRSTGPQHESRHWHHVLHCHLHAISHKNGLDEAIQIINFVKSWSLNTCVFLIFHVIKWKAYIKHFCYNRYCDCLKEKYFCDWVASWTMKTENRKTLFFCGISFLLKRMTDKTFYRKRTKWACYFKYLLPMIFQSFGLLSKKNVHSYLKRFLKYSSLF